MPCRVAAFPFPFCSPTWILPRRGTRIWLKRLELTPCLLPANTFLPSNPPHPARRRHSSTSKELRESRARRKQKSRHSLLANQHIRPETLEGARESSCHEDYERKREGPVGWGCCSLTELSEPELIDYSHERTSWRLCQIQVGVILSGTSTIPGSFFAPVGNFGREITELNDIVAKQFTTATS